MGLDPTSDRPDPSTPAGNRPWEDVPRGMKLVALYFLINFVFMLLLTGEVLSVGGSAAGILGTVLLIISLVGLVSAYGLVLAKPWAYLGTLAVGALLLVVNLVALNILRVGLLGLILYYVYHNGEAYVQD